jgi:Ca-activated chloride channel homolog
MLRHSRILSVFALTAGLLVPVGASLAQNAQNPGTSQDEIPVFTADTRLVVVHASVLDRNGKLITNLSESAFKVQENGVDQTITIFRREDIPVSMGIIIDNSGSMRDKSAKVAAALDLVRASNP